VAEPQFDAPIPGMGMTHELGARPWQNPPLYTTVDEALDYYVPRMASDDFSEQLMDVMEMGIPLTTLANTIQLSGVMDGKHSADVGILIMPVLIEMMRFIGDSADIEYTTGLDKDKGPRSSLVTKAINKLRVEEQGEEDAPQEEEAPAQEELPMEMPDEPQPSGLMARRT
jgi:hypothetical protein